MKIPVKTIRLQELDSEYGQYEMTLPRSVKEKWVRKFQAWSREGQNDPDIGAAANIEMMSLVESWNLDDDSGKVLPLIKDVPDKIGKDGCKEDRHAEDCPKLAVLGELPIEVIVFVAQKVAGGGNVAEKTEDFSSAS